MRSDGRHCDGSRARAAVTLLAALVLLAVAAVPPATAAAKRLGDRTLAPGSRGHDVRTAQRALTALRFPARPVDGIYGRRTALAVRRWERARRQRVDGRLSRAQGRRVRNELLRQRARNGGGDPAAPGEAAEVGPGASAETVARAQRALATLRFDVGAADGAYGESTAAAIGDYQGVSSSAAPAGSPPRSSRASRRVSPPSRPASAPSRSRGHGSSGARAGASATTAARTLTAARTWRRRAGPRWSR